MAMHSATADWVAALPPRTVFTSREVPGTRGAVDSALSRLATGPDAPLSRVRQGIYWRKPATTRFGTGVPDPVAVALKAAGHGAGLAGVSALNALGLTTQVPSTPTIAVLGRAPKGLTGVRVISRSNLERIHLGPTEVALLEALRVFPRHAEVDLAKLHRVVTDLVVSGDIDPDRVRTVARTERSAGLCDRLEWALV